MHKTIELKINLAEDQLGFRKNRSNNMLKGNHRKNFKNQQTTVYCLPRSGEGL